MTTKTKGRPPITDVDYTRARARKMEADANLAELELSKALKEIVDTADVLEAWVEVLGAMRSKLLSLPSKVAPILSTETSIGNIQHIIEQQIREALDELSTYQPAIAAGKTRSNSKRNETSDGNVEAAAAPKNKRVGRPRKATKL